MSFTNSSARIEVVVEIILEPLIEDSMEVL
jgi:hypothetical protein